MSLETDAVFTGFELLGEAVISSIRRLEGAPIGGLSGLAYDAERDYYYAISDDPASRGPARFYTLDIDLSGESLDSKRVEVVAVTELLDRDHEPFAEMTLDLEGLAFSRARTLYISSEGHVERGVEPFLREYELDGTYIRDLPVPNKFLHRAGRTGVRHNLGFEGLTLDQQSNWLYTATENALLQDGRAADLGIASPTRILRLDRESGRSLAEFVYVVAPVRDSPLGAADFRTRGLVELISLDDSHLLALERAYTQGVGHVVEIFLVSLEGATDVRQWKSLEGMDFQAVVKTRLLQLEVLGLELDNLEGMTLGPRLADGRRSLVLLADNNFDPRQRNQILAFAVEDVALSAARIQGPGHRSQLEGAWARQIHGTVTSRAARGSGFWMQGGDDQDVATSDAVFVLPSGEASPAPGDVVRVDGLVRETGFQNTLTVTSLEEASFEVLERAAPLPDPVVVGSSGSRGSNGGARQLPSAHIDDDNLAIFDPGEDAIDFLESLEGMRLALLDARVVGPSTRSGEFSVLFGEPLEAVRSPAGGLVATPGEIRPGPIPVVTQPGFAVPQVAVGDRFDGPVTGILDYAFGTFRILAEALPATTSRPPTPAPALERSESQLSIATYNVENLSARSRAEKFARLARSIAESLASPDIVALQEIQDDSGPENDGTVSAERTLGLLVDAILEAGGPRYEHASVDPEDLADGGRPGANIRVAYLYRPDRVRLVRRGTPDANSAAEWLLDERGPFLSPNPSRVNPNHPAFAAAPDRNLSGVRKPLAAEFEFNDHRLFLINVHMRSKRGDSPLFGSVQPPTRPTQSLRGGEALVIREFLDRLLELDPEAAAIALGDFNEHPYREPLGILARAGLHNLVERVPRNQRYTYIFRGTSQVLDNVLVTQGLDQAAVASVEIVHLNADLPDAYRASDHDPILVLLRFP